MKMITTSQELSRKKKKIRKKKKKKTTTTTIKRNNNNNERRSSRTRKKKFIPYPFEYGEELIVRVESLSNLGMGVCRTLLSTNSSSLQHHQSKNKEKQKQSNNNTTTTSNNNTTTSNATITWVIFVPYTIPNETIKIRIIENQSTYSIGKIVTILQSSPERRLDKDMCMYYGTCGGCQYQHIQSIDTQRYYKTIQVQESMERIGKFTILNTNTKTDDSSSTSTSLTCPEIQPTIGTEEVWDYRSKLTPHYSSNNDNNIIIGFESNDNTLIDISSCRIATNTINDQYSKLRQQLKNEKESTRTTLLLRDSIQIDTTREEDTNTKTTNVVITDPNEYVTNRIMNNTLLFRFRANNFFQTNPYVLDLMISTVIDAATSKNINMTHFIDCYCGSGLFAISMAASVKKLQHCVGIEINDDAIQEAKYNAKLNSLPEIQFMAASAQAIFQSNGEVDDITTFPRETTVVMIDPPRKGCSVEFIQQLLQYQPQRIVYMSCNVITQARDARLIVSDNMYKITSIQPFDLFPQTRHIECLMVFDKII